MFGFFRRLIKAENNRPAVTETQPESEAEASLIRACRARFGPPPRSLSADDAEACRLSLLPELEAEFRESNDPRLRILADQQALLDRG